MKVKWGSGEGFSRIKNTPKVKLPRDFHFNSFSFLILIISLIGAIAVQQAYMPADDVINLIYIGGAFIWSGIILALFPVWGMVVMVIAAGILAGFYWLGTDFWPAYAIGAAGVVFSASFQLVYHWDKVVVLRMGKFRKVYGPGIHFLFPFLDRAAAYIDTRIRATDFSAERTLTSDSVPVHVDALAFWMIWDARKAVLEVENYLEAVTLSAQTALRDSIGKHKLSSLLSEKEALGKEIQAILDAKTNPWGITILSVEFTDVIIPQQLEDAMSKQAQADRERQSRVILSEAEVEVAKKFEEASIVYKDNPTAMQLRAMNMVYEGIRQNKGSLMLLPSSALDNLNLGGVMGTAAMQQVQDQKINGQEKDQLSQEEDS